MVSLRDWIGSIQTKRSARETPIYSVTHAHGKRIAKSPARRSEHQHPYIVLNNSLCIPNVSDEFLLKKQLDCDSHSPDRGIVVLTRQAIRADQLQGA
jgi:hypothetical protein